MISAKKKRILLIETTLRTLPFTKLLLKSIGSSISKKIYLFIYILWAYSNMVSSINYKMYNTKRNKKGYVKRNALSYK